MQPQTANRTADQIKLLFPNVNVAILGAIVQELITGVYDADAVLVWANWYRGESQMFNLDAMRAHFAKDQPRNRPSLDARTQAFRRQTEENQKAFEQSKTDSDRFDQFFGESSDEELEQLKADILPTLPENMRLRLSKESPRSHRLLRRLIHQVACKAQTVDT